VILASLIGASVLSASNQTWTNAAGGDWNTGANWTSAIPAVGDNATLTTVAGNYTVTYSSPMAAASFGALALNGTVGNTTTMNITASGFNSSGSSAALSVGGNATLNVNAGGVALFSGPNLLVAPNITGALNINGGSVTFQGTQYGLGISGGGQITVNSGTLSASAVAGGGGVNAGIRVVGGGSFLINGGTVSFLNSGMIGYFNQGSGTLTMTAGALNIGATVPNDFTIGNLNASGNATVSGGAVTNYGTLTIASDAYAATGVLNLSGGSWVQQNGNAVYIGSIRGNGSINVTGTGQFTTTGNTTLGNWDGISAFDTASGTLLINGGSYTGANLTVRRGSLNLQSGNLTVNALVATNGSNGTVSFSGGTLDTKATTIANGSVFTVGNGTAVAAMKLDGGSHSFANGITLSNNATLSGNGTITLGTLVVSSGARISPGNTGPGVLGTAAQTWLGGGSYVWKMNDATGIQGTNWDFLNGSGTLDVSTLSPSSKFIIDLVGLAVGNVSGPVPNWNKNVDQTWKIGTFASITGTFNAADFNVDASGFTNNNPLIAGGVFSISNVGNDIFLSYTTPEPATWILLAVGLTTAIVFRRRRST